MYNDNNQMIRGPYFLLGGGGSHPLPPPPPPLPPVSNAFQQQPHNSTTPPPPPPPSHFQQQGAPLPFRGNVNHPFQVPPGGVMQNAGQYGNSMTFGQNSQHSQPPPTLWAQGPPSRTLPPRLLPPPPYSQGQILDNLPFIPPPLQGFMAPGPDGVLHSNVGNYQVSSVAPPPPPPLPSSPPPILPSPPPPAPPISYASSLAVDSVDRAVGSYPSGVAPVHNSDPDRDSGSCREVTAADRDKLLSTSSMNLDLPPPPPQPAEEETVQKIEALCQLISENGPAIEDKVRQEEFQNPEYAFLFGGDLGTDASNSHAYFLWMKKKYNLEHKWHEKKSESPFRPVAVESTGPQYQTHVATEGANSDMEMEDDITLGDKDQGRNYAIQALTQQDHRVGEEISMNENIHQLEISTENDPAKIHSLVNDSSEVVDSPLGIALENSVPPLAKDFTPNVTSDLTGAINPNRDARELTRSGSLIRLLQDYTSDNTSDIEDKTCRTDAIINTASAGAIGGVSVAHRYSGNCLETDIGSKSPSSAQKGLGQVSKTTLNDSEIFPVQESRGHIEDNNENQMSIPASAEALHAKDELGGGWINSDSKSGNAEQEDEWKGTSVKLDKYGRHPREDPTDSDSGSDDSHYHQTRRVNKRGRDWSRSRSPLERSRRRKSPRGRRRRRDRRSQSCSLSPRRRRSRSRSPIRRRTGAFARENSKRDRGQCFDFIRGKCYRGASCRFSHHESDKNASLRRHRNKHDQDVYSCSRNSRMNEGIVSSELSDHQHDAIRNQDADPRQNAIDQVKKRKEDSFRHAVVSTSSGVDSQTVSTDPIKSESFREAAPEMQEALVQRQEPNKTINDNDSFPKALNSPRQYLVDGFHPEPLSGGDAFKPSGGTHEDAIHSEEGSFVHQIQPNVSVGVSGHSDYLPQLLNTTFVCSSSSDQMSMISSGANKGSSSEPLPYMIPSTQPLSAPSSVGPLLSSEHPLLHPYSSKELIPHSSSSVELPPHANQLPPAVSDAQGENAVHLPQISRGGGMMVQNALLPLQSTAREKNEPYPAPLHTHNPHFSVTPNYSWTSLPPPPPLPPPQQPPSEAVYSSSLPPNSEVSKSFVSSEFIQSQLHSGADFISQASSRPGLPSQSQGSELQDQAYPPMLDHSGNFMPMKAFFPKHVPQGNPASQSLSGLNLSREDYYKQFSVQDSKFSSTASLHSQSNQYSWHSDASRLQPSFSGQLPSDDHFKTSSHIYPLSQKQPSIYSQYSSSEGNLGMPLETSTASRYPPGVLDSNHSTSLPTIGGSRISAHYNPYASTFEQPLSSIFSSSIFRQESDVIHGNNHGSPRLNPTVNREVFDGVRPRHTVSSPKSARAVGQILPRPTDKQYDPLFDSIEPTSDSLKKFDFDQKQEVTGESNVSLRPKSSCMSLYVEEQNKQEEVAAVASITSQNNDEYGETADTEEGDVENDSLSNHEDVANMAAGDAEINQIKSPGKRRKGKDSRSMKLFKVSIANFVKDVLKPSWRQGNMSKVAFKTIVKKTVDKVSGSMKGHHIPKSQAKISQYIDSSQRKLTKLVMGYVDKYVKA